MGFFVRIKDQTAAALRQIGFVLIVAVAVFASQSPAHAVIEIDINKGQVEPMPVAIPNFVGDPKFGPDIAGVISNNLRRSGLFNPLPPSSYIEQITDFASPPRFGDWR
ncbi:MAG: Tol-Pal system protein TolB, partial [Rhizobiales bacterium]|nr:Tol-Pal system protein TolB [Hyphomicrobiales bacterium]